MGSAVRLDGWRAARSPRWPPATLTATTGHAFWTTEHGWITAGELRPGDHLVGADGSRSTVAAVSSRTAVATVHNLTVDDRHTYYVLAGGAPALVHNCTTTIYRYQEQADSMRLGIDSGGNVSINGGGMLHLNMSGDITHSQSFRGSGGHIVAFDVPTTYVDRVRANAIGQRPPRGMGRREWNIFKHGRAQIDDRRQTGLYGLPSEMFDELLSNVVPGSGRILPGGG